MGVLQGRRVLITGAAGFIGANLARELIQEGAVVHAIIRAQTNLWRIKNLLPSLTLHEGDLLRRRWLQSQVREIKPEYVFHMAIRREDTTSRYRINTLKTNVMGLVNLLEATREIDYECFVNAGSSLEYGPGEKAHEETDNPHPRIFFSATKAAASLLAQQFAWTTGKPVITLRIFSAYGFWEYYHHLIPKAIMACLNDLEIDLTERGLRRDWVFVSDVIEAFVLAAQTKGIGGEIFNIGSGRERTNEYIVEAMQEIMRKPLRIGKGAYPARESDTQHWVADTRKTKRQLGWSARHKIESGLQETVEWLTKHRKIYDEFMKAERS